MYQEATKRQEAKLAEMIEKMNQKIAKHAAEGNPLVERAISEEMDVASVALNTNKEAWPIITEKLWVRISQE